MYALNLAVRFFAMCMARITRPATPDARANCCVNARQRSIGFVRYAAGIAAR